MTQKDQLTELEKQAHDADERVGDLVGRISAIETRQAGIRTDLAGIHRALAEQGKQLVTLVAHVGQILEAMRMRVLSVDSDGSRVTLQTQLSKKALWTIGLLLAALLATIFDSEFPGVLDWALGLLKMLATAAVGVG